MANAANDSTGRSAIARFIDVLKARVPGADAPTALPEQLDAVVRQVERNATAGASLADEHLTARFTQAATSIGAQVHSATITNWLDVVVGVLQMHRVKAVAIPSAGDGFFEAGRVEQLRERLAAEGIHAKSETDDETLFSVDAAVTGVVVAIAEAGTLVCESGPVVARGSSLIPPVHVAVVETTQILPDLLDCLEAFGERSRLPASTSLITGPSKTADIEGELVTGVHGPGHVHVVLVENRG
jgi:L-lactate dehydrogenase complex protein LldG